MHDDSEIDILTAMQNARATLDRAIQPKIFICYRRSDSSGESSHLADRLSARFGRSKFFFDISAIQSGVNYEHALAKAREAALIMLVVIGDQWLSAKGTSGSRRLDEEDDPVRIELETGLQRGIVFPVLVKGASMPQRFDLPTHICDLASIQAFRISHETFDHDFDGLVNTLNQRLPEEDTSDAPRIAGADHIVTGGVVDPYREIYIDREADSRVAQFLKTGSGELLVHAPPMFGKSSLLVKALLRARNDGRATAFIDLSRLGTKLTFREFILGLASDLSEQLSVRLNDESFTSEPVTAFLDMIATIPESSLIVIDELDIIKTYSCPELIGDILAILPKLSKGLGKSFNYIMAGLFTSVDHSRFIKAFSDLKSIELSHFNSVETRIFLERARTPLSDNEFMEVFSLTGGHPFLVAASARVLSERWSVGGLISVAPEKTGPFGHHVQWVINSMRNLSPVRDGMCALLRGEPVSTTSKALLQRLGLVKESANQLQFACSFYKRLVPGECSGTAHVYGSDAESQRSRRSWHAKTLERIRSLVGHRGDSASSSH